VVWPGMEIVFTILVVSAFFQGLLLLGIRLLQALGGRNEFLKISIPIMIFDVIITWIIIPLWGATGIALIRLCSYAIASIMVLFSIWKRTSPRILREWLMKLFVISTIITVTIIAQNYLPISSLWLFLLELLVILSEFIILIKVFKMINDEDRKRLISTFPFLHPVIKLIT
jgi:O-antigen/teichoic acid export membrane protein